MIKNHFNSIYFGNSCQFINSTIFVVFIYITMPEEEIRCIFDDN